MFSRREIIKKVTKRKAFRKVLSVFICTLFLLNQTTIVDVVTDALGPAVSEITHPLDYVGDGQIGIKGSAYGNAYAGEPKGYGPRTGGGEVVAKITFPGGEKGRYVGDGPISIIGNAYGQGVRRYTLYYKAASATSWTYISGGTRPVVNGVLRNLWYLSNLAEGEYELKLSVMTALGVVLAEDIVRFVHLKRLLPGWPVSVAGMTTHPAVGDINGGTKEVVIGSYTTDGLTGDTSMDINVFDYRARPLQGWPKTFNWGRRGSLSAADFSVALGDLDGDYKPDIVFGSPDGKVHAFKYDGSYVNGWPQVFSSEERFVTPVILADLDQDARLEVILAATDTRTRTATVYVWNSDGSIRMEQELGGWVFPNNIAAGDLDSDGELEIVVLAAGDQGNIHLLKTEGMPQLSSFWGPGFSHGIALGDIYGDRRLGLVGGSIDGRIYLYDLVRGSLPIDYIPGSGRQLFGQPVLADVTSDGNPEIVIAHKDQDASFTDYNGFFTLSLGSSIVGSLLFSELGINPPSLGTSLAVGDTTAPVTQKDVVSGGYGGILGWKANMLNGASDPWFYPPDIDKQFFNLGSTPQISNLVGRNEAAIVFGVGNYVFAIRTDGVYDDTIQDAINVEWPRFHHDLYNTNNYSYLDHFSDPKGGPTWYIVSGLIPPPLPGETLYERLNRGGLEGVTVTAETADGRFRRTATTDWRGLYVLERMWANQEYAITPSYESVVFIPRYRTVRITNQHITDAHFTPTSLSISGTIKNPGDTYGLYGVTVRATDSAQGITYTGTSYNENGDYSIQVTNGNYIVTPALAGYTFEPPYRNVVVYNEDMTGMDFTYSALPTDIFSISGTITHSEDSSAFPGVTVTATPGGNNAPTDENGKYTISGLSSGTYTVIPSKSGYAFEPASASVTISNANVTGKNFTATVQKPFISGRIVTWSSSPAGIPGVRLLVDRRGFEEYVTTDADGYYKTGELTSGQYHVRPISGIMIFTPEEKVVDIEEDPVTGIGFWAYAPESQYIILGTIRLENGSPLVGVEVFVDRTTLPHIPRKGLTNEDGVYDILNIPLEGQYSVDPEKEGYTFRPAGKIVTVNNLGNTINVVNFTAIPEPTLYSISGRVTHSEDDSAFPGVTVRAGNRTGTTWPDGGYTISGLSNGSYSIWPSAPGYTFEPPSRTATIDNANVTGQDFKAIADHIITATAGEGGSIDPSGNVSVSHGSSQSFTITPNTGYVVEDVKVDGASVGAVLSYTFNNVTADHTIHATFSIITHTITATTGQGGSISPSGNVSVNHGANQKFTITPNTGYVVEDVEVDGTSIGAVSDYTFINVRADHTIQAMFKLGAYSISGTVTRKDNGAPLPGVTINAVGKNGGTGSATTLLNGWYSIDGLLSDRYTVTPSLSGFAFDPPKLEFDLNANVTGKNFKAIPGYSISGRIIKDTGSAAAGVTISVKKLPVDGGAIVGTATTDASGEYTVNDLPFGLTLYAIPSHPDWGFYPYSRTVTGPQNAVDFTALTGSISGYVKDDGAGVSNATVTITQYDGAFAGSDVTDTNGYYKVERLWSNNILYTMRPSHVRYTFSPSADFVRATAENVNFEAYRRTYTITGNVTRQDNSSALAGVTITATGSETATLTTTTGSNGRYTLTAPSDIYTLTPSLSDYTFEPTLRNIDLLESTSGQDFTAIPPVYEISGKVANKDGVGLSNIKVKIQGGSNSIDTFAITGSDGRYSKQGLYSGIYVVKPTPTASGITFEPSFREVYIPAPSALEVDFTARFKVSGYVTLLNGGAGGASLTLKNADTTRTTTTDAFGRFEFTELDSGAYTITASWPGYKFDPEVKEIAVTTDSITNVGFSALPTISGRVAYADGKGLAGVTINGVINTATTDANGDYSMAVTQNGMYTVWPSRDGITFTPTERRVDVVNTPVTGVDFEAGLSISGRVSIDNGELGSYGIIASTPGQPDKHAIKWSNGTYIIRGLLNDATYTVTPSGLGHVFDPASRQVALSNDTSATGVDFNARRLSISGRVTLENGTGLYWVKVTAKSDDHEIYVRTDINGYYKMDHNTIDQLKPATYTLTPTMNGYGFEPASEDVTLSYDNPKAANKDFTAKRLSISGKITIMSADGEPFANQVISVEKNGQYYISVNTDTNGRYSFNTESNTTYTLTPFRRTGFAFEPQSAVVPIVNVSKTQDFIAKPLIITGKITTEEGKGLPGVNVTAEATGITSQWAYTNSNGEYTIHVYANAVYTVTPTKRPNGIDNYGYYFEPKSREAAVNNGPAEGIDFTAKPLLISGKVTLKGTQDGLKGVRVTATPQVPGLSPLSDDTGDDGTYAIHVYSYDTTYTVTPSNTGYAFEPTSRQAAINGASAPDINFEAERLTYTITSTASIGGSISPSGAVLVTYGTDKTFTITPDNDYRIEYVLVDGISKGAISTYTFTNVTANHTIHATFGLIPTYTITATADAGGNISPSGDISVTAGSSQTFTITANGGYVVDKVYVDGAFVGAVTSYTFQNVQANHTIRATFKVKAYTITATAGIGGSIDPRGTVSVLHGRDQAFSITANGGHLIKDVLVDGVSVGAVSTYTFTNVTANHTIQATFKEGYTITASAAVGGSISPNGKVGVDKGANKTFTITPDNGYAIKDVIIDGGSWGGISTYTFINVRADHTIHATFIKLHIITATADQGGSISPNGIVSVVHGGDKTFIITPANGYRVKDVFIDGSSVGAVSTYTFTNVTADHTIQATFKEGYTIIATAEPLGGSINPNGQIYVDKGANKTFTITPYNGYRIKDVKVDGASVGAVSTYTFTNVTANHNIHARFHEIEPVFHTITATAGADGSISPNGSITVNHTANQIFTITPNTGYQIADVLVDGASVGAVSTYAFMIVTTDHTIHATFSAITHIITATAGTGGSISPNGNVSVTHGANKTFSITANTGYRIADVLVDGASVGAPSAYAFFNVTANHTIHAAFAITHTITATAGTGGGISPNGDVSVTHGANKTFNITANTGYRIADVFVDGTSIGAVSTYTFINVTANHSIRATFSEIEPVTHTITATAGTGGNISPSGNVSVNHGTTRAFTITASAGYQIADVRVDNVSVGAVSTYTFNNVTADHTIRATFSIRTYTITATTGQGGSISPSGNVSVNHGTNRTFTITASAGYQIADVRVDNASVGAVSTYTFTNVITNHTIRATFAEIEPVTHIITATSGVNGNISPGGNVSVAHGANKTFTIIPSAGYRVADVRVDNISVGAVTTYTFNNVTADHTIHATFSIITHIITATAGAGGGISPSGNVSVNHGANRIFTITPNTGYQIADVLVDGVSVGAGASYTFTNVTADHTIHATFSASTYTLTIDIVGSGTVTRNLPGPTYPAGTVVTLTAIPGAGYTFDGWSGDLSGTQNPAQITMTSNKKVVALFANASTYTLTIDIVGSGTVTRNLPGPTYPAGTVVTLTAIPGAGYTFDGWSGDLSGTTNPAQITMNSNKKVTALFANASTYTLTVDIIGSGTVTRNLPGPTYPAGTVVTLTAIPGAGYTFDGWSGDLSGTQNPAQITMNSNKKVTALFANASTYTLTVNIVGSGTVTKSPPGPTYPAGSVVTLTAIPGAGSTFTGWSGNLSGTTNPATITMNSNKSVTAHFTAGGANYSISGRVIDLYTEEGIGGVTLLVYNVLNPDVIVGGAETAPESGNYTVSGLPNGTYAVRPVPMPGVIEFTSEQEYAYINGSSVSGINFWGYYV